MSPPLPKHKYDEPSVPKLASHYTSLKSDHRAQPEIPSAIQLRLNPAERDEFFHCAKPRAFSSHFSITQKEDENTIRAELRNGDPVPNRGSDKKIAGEHLIGQTIGPYRILSLIGIGGKAKVFEALHLFLERKVAFKVLHLARVIDDELRFVGEARVLSKLKHPNVCPIYDVGTTLDNRLYLVMERLVGSPLSEHLAEHGKMNARDVIKLLLQLLSGLAAAHEGGILHRDIKPDNLFLEKSKSSFFNLKILDFGLSKQISSSPIDDEPNKVSLSVTQEGLMIGTPHYMSPEQVRGQKKLDWGVDIYACGTIAYELLAGKKPFSAKNFATLFIKILNEEPESLALLRPDLPPGLVAIITKAMRKEPSERYVSALAMRHDLLNALTALDPWPHSLFSEQEPKKVSSTPNVSGADLGSIVRPLHRNHRILPLKKVESSLSQGSSKRTYDAHLLGPGSPYSAANLPKPSFFVKKG